MNKFFVLRVCEAMIDWKRDRGRPNAKFSIGSDDERLYAHVIRMANGYDCVPIVDDGAIVDAKVFYVEKDIDVSNAPIFELLGEMAKRDRNIDIFDIFSRLPQGVHEWTKDDFDAWNAAIWHD